MMPSEPEANSDRALSDSEAVCLLLIDDSLEHSVVVESIVAGLGHQLVKVGSGDEAFRFLLHNDVAAILLNTNMPGLDGRETASRLRQRERSAQTPILLLMADIAEADCVSEGNLTGLVDYIQTPIVPELLRSRLAMLVKLHQKTEHLQQLFQLEQGRSARLSKVACATENTLENELRLAITRLADTLKVMTRGKFGGAEFEQVGVEIERQVEDLSHRVDDLLDAFRIAGGRIDLNLELLDIADVVAEAIAVTRKDFESRRLHLEVSLPVEPLGVDGDRARLVQVLSNLLQYAAMNTNPGGRIGLTAVRDREIAVISLGDHGGGIAADMLDRDSEWWVPVDPALNRVRGGGGIGLQLARTLIELHGGSVSARSLRFGQGVDFVVRLPLADRVSPPPMPRDEVAVVTGYRIVLVEDNSDVREMLRELLGYDGHHVEVADDGPRGLEVIRRCRPDVALIDIGLPGLDGYQVARQVRSIPGGGEILLIALSGYSQPEDRRRALEAGFNAHLAKPVRLDQLSALLAQHA